MKRVLATVLLCSLATSAALAKPNGQGQGQGHDHSQGQSPVSNPGPDIVVNLPNTPAPFHANFHSPVSNVPEPESVALMIAGVAVVGAVAWRRRNRK